VLHHDQVRAADAGHDAMHIDNIDVVKLSHHRRLHQERKTISFRSHLAQRLYGYWGRRLTNRRQTTLADVTELICNRQRQFAQAMNQSIMKILTRAQEPISSQLSLPPTIM